MANKEATQSMMQLNKPISGKSIVQLQLSLKMLEEHGWKKDALTDTMNPPKANP